MAAFNPQLNQNLNNFVGYSRGSEPDLSMGTAMKGLGNIISQGAQALDENVQANIREDVYEGFDSTNDAFGVDTQAMLSDQAVGVPSAPALPSEVEEGRTFIQRLTNARDSGALKESHYWGKLETMVKSLRAKYPGYREQIDNIVADVTGTTPANALRNSLLQEINQENAKRDAGKVNVETFINQNMEDIPEALLIRHQGGEDVYDEMQREVASRKRERQSFADQKEEMARQVQTRQLSVTAANETLRAEVNSMMNRSISDASYVAGADYNAIIKQAQEASADTVISKEEDQMIRANLRNLETAWLLQFDKIAGGEWKKGSPDSYNSFLSPAELEGAKELIKTRISTLQNMLLNQQTGLLGSNQAAIDAIKSEAGLRVLGSDPIFPALAGIEAAGMSEMMNSIFLSDGGAEILSSTVKAIKDLFAMKAVAGQLPSMTEGVRDMKRMKVEDPKGYELFIENTVDALVNPASSPEGVLNAANTLFKDNRDFVLEFAPEAQIKVFATLASPEVTKRMNELREAGHTQQWEDYVRWTTDNFGVIFSQKGATLQEAFDSAKDTLGNSVSIVYDEDSGQFEPDFNIDTTSMSEQDFQYSQMQQFFLDEGIKELNTYIKFLDPILEITGEDKTKVIEQMMRSIGIEFEAEEENEGDLGDRGSLEDTSMRGIQLASARGDGQVSNISSGNAFLDFVADAEGTDRGRGYNETLAYGEFTGGDVELTSMTLDEVDALQSEMLRHPGNNYNSSAVGRYQIVRQTLRSLRDRLGLDGTELYDEAMQDRLALELARGRGANAVGLRNEWEGLRRRNSNDILAAYASL